MGMAASQARYIELTARKTDVEYQGQQINQQRTALANESAGMFSQLMSLTVPTPPSTEEFTTTQYTFNDGDNDYTITNIANLSGNPMYNSTVSYYYTEPVYTPAQKTRTDLGARDVGGTFWLTNGIVGSGSVNQVQLEKCSTTGESYQADKKALDAIAGKYPSSNIAMDYASDISNIWKYKDTNGLTRYYSDTDLVDMPISGAASSLSGYYATDIDTKQYTSEPAYVTKSNIGRYASIQLQSMEGTTLDLTASSHTDEIAYQNAMNDYEYKQQTYAKSVEDINAKTKIIQQEDRTLEMKLKQLDTEQEALQTEMESVKKVIDKNIEQTFKTFQ